MRSPFVGLAVAAASGIILADYFPSFLIPVAVAGLVAALIGLRWSSTATVLLLVAIAFYVLHSSRLHRWPPSTEDRLRVATVTGNIASEPKIDPNGRSTFLLGVRRIRFEQGPEEACAETFLTRWRGHAEIGDTVMLFGTLEPIEAPRNPGEFEMRAYLARKDVQRIFIVRYPENGHLVDHGSPFNVRRLAAKARDWMQRTLSRGLEDSPEVISLICGTSLGLRHQTPDDIEEPFQQTGTLHLFAVAGLHVGIVATLLWTLAGVARLPRKVATALIIPSLFFYAAITGLHTASIRAAVMSAVLLGGIFFDRKVFALNSLAAAAFLILLFDSNELFTSGFQLSFCVVGTIILFADPLYRWLRTLVQPDPFLPHTLFRPGRRATFAFLDHLISRAPVQFRSRPGSVRCR